MNIRFYCDLYISNGWEKKQLKLMKKLMQNKLQPSVYVITLAQGKQNHLEFFSSVLLKQHIFEHSDLFVVGLANGYDDALYMLEQITQQVLDATGTVDLRKFIEARQLEFDRKLSEAAGAEKQR